MALVMMSGVFGCEPDSAVIQHEYGDFLVQKNDDGWWISGLSDTGKEKEVIVIPAEIDGHPIVRVAKKYAMKIGSAWLGSENIEKVFYVKYKKTDGGAFMSAINLSKIIIIGIKEFCDLSNSQGRIQIYYQNNYEITAGQYFNYMHHADISYYYNYSDAPNNGYYWIDDYEYGGMITFVPPQVARDGYSFVGWYKEAECVNIWNFAEDRLPQAQYNEDDGIIYQETKLYARWQ
jgi:hypothetical protein